MLEVFVFSIKMMFKNKMRSFLTMLGIIIGILSLILIVVFGKSFTATFESVTESLFKNDMLMVYLTPTEDNNNVVYDEYGSVVIPEGVCMDIRNVEKIIKKISKDSYIKVGGIISGNGVGEYLGRTTKFSVDSACANEMVLMGYKIQQGRDISRSDEVYKASVAVVSDVAAKYLFNGEDAIGKSLNLTVDGIVVPVNIVGIYKLNSPVDENVSEAQTMIFVNHTFVEAEMTGILSNSYWEQESINITMKSINDKDQFKQDVLDAIGASLNYDKWTLDAYSLSESIGTTNALISIILKIIFVIAAISLVIGGIGLMNVMLITVTERTNEIGVRKALGADNGVIIFQFLCESFVLSLSGTIIGLILGYLMSMLLGYLAGGMLGNSLGMPVTVDVNLPFSVIMIAILFSLAIGVVFGLYPAIKAVKMQVVDALRYE